MKYFRILKIHSYFTFNFDFNEANPEHIKEFKSTKESLENQLKDYAWRIEQENKARETGPLSISLNI